MTAALLIALGATAQTTLLALDASPDVYVEPAGTPVDDEEVARFATAGGVFPLFFAPLPPGVDLIAHQYEASGESLLVFDTTVALGALTAGPRDVVRYSGATYSLEFDGAAAGIPPGTRIDAVSQFGSFLLLSFDTAVDLGGSLADDEDIVQWSGSFLTLLFDLSAAGVPPELDLDGLYYIESVGAGLLSFDGSGVIAGIPFDDEDVLEFDGLSWSLAYDASAVHAELGGGPDLDSLSALPDPDGDGLWDGAESLLGTDPLDADTDDDGLSDGAERDANGEGTDPLNPDTDGDGILDGTEVANGTDPLDPFDPMPSVPALGRIASGLLAVLLALGGAARLRSRG